MQKIIDIFHDIAKPFEKGNGLKEEFILRLLNEHDAKYIENIGIIVPSKKTKKITVTSHIDLIKKFNKSFRDSPSILIKDNILSGALDNTLTNAILILAIQELRSNGFAEDVEFVFTEGEETGFLGMKEYISRYGKNTFFINLDVTNDNWECFGSIEYDHPNFHICKQIEKTFSKEIGFTTERVNDDLCAVISSGGRGFSYCIPSKNEIHSFNNYTLIDKIEKYYNGLLFLIKDMDFSSYEHNIKNIQIYKALRYESEKQFLKKMKKRKEKILDKIKNKKKGRTIANMSDLEFVRDFDKFREEDTESVADRAIFVLQEYDINNRELFEFIRTEANYRSWITREDFLLVSFKKETYQVIDLLVGASLLEEDEIYKRWRFVRKVPKF